MPRRRKAIVKTIRTIRLLRSKLISRKRIIWVASYPRSGNTWMRTILAGLFGSPIENIPDIHENPKAAFFSASEFRVKDTKVCFVKIHFNGFTTHLFPKHCDGGYENAGFIYLYRHPLDMFVSALNFLMIYRREEHFSSVASQSVRELSRSGEIDEYVAKFIDSHTIGDQAFFHMWGNALGSITLEPGSEWIDQNLWICHSYSNMRIW